jgi:hypothetical protein
VHSGTAVIGAGSGQVVFMNFNPDHGRISNVVD